MAARFVPLDAEHLKFVEDQIHLVLIDCMRAWFTQRYGLILCYQSSDEARFSPTIWRDTYTGASHIQFFLSLLVDGYDQHKQTPIVQISWHDENIYTINNFSGSIRTYTYAFPGDLSSKPLSYMEIYDIIVRVQESIMGRMESISNRRYREHIPCREFRSENFRNAHNVYYENFDALPEPTFRCDKFMNWCKGINLELPNDIVQDNIFCKTEMVDIGNNQIKTLFSAGNKFPRSCKCEFMYRGDEQQPDILIASLTFHESIEIPTMEWYYFRNGIYKKTEYDFKYGTTVQSRTAFQTEHAGHLRNVIYNLIPLAKIEHKRGGRPASARRQKSEGYSAWLHIENIVNQLDHL